MVEEQAHLTFIATYGRAAHGLLPGMEIEAHPLSIASRCGSVICDYVRVLNVWRWVDADDDQVADFLAASVQGLIESDGWINPDARIIARDGQVHIECAAADGEPLIRVPAHAMLPISRIDWDSSSDILRVARMREWPAKADLSQLFTQIGLHNSCEKIPRLVMSHPSASIEVDEVVVSAIRAVRPSFRARPMSPAEVFWATRTFRLAAFDDVAEPVAIPVIDLLNHHPRGSAGQWHDGSFTVTVHHPEDSAECFLDYGMDRDALDMTLVYGFADTTGSWMHSGQVTTQIAGIGTLRVLDQGRSPTGAVQPLTINRVSDGWELNRFTFNAPGTRQSDDRIALQSQTQQSREWCDQVVAALARANLNLIDELDRALAHSKDTEAIRTLKATSSHLRSVLNTQIDR